MATIFTTEEMLAFVTGGDNFGLSDSASSEDSDGAISAYRISKTVSTEDFLDLSVIELLYTGGFVC